APDAAPWGRPRPRGREGYGRRDRTGFQRCLSDAASTHRSLCRVADPQPRSALAAVEAQPDRPHGGRNGQGERSWLMPTLARRVFSEALGTAFLLAAVVGSGIM